MRRRRLRALVGVPPLPNDTCKTLERGGPPIRDCSLAELISTCARRSQFGCGEKEMARPKSKNVGVIGLGIIGSRIAGALRKRGLQVFVWNRTPRPEQNFVGSPAEVA